MIEDADAANAYLHFVHALCEMACNQKRISVQEREVENEKYAFRCFLLRLGFIGEEYKVEGVGAVLGLEKQKLTEGKDLILERQSQRTR